MSRTLRIRCRFAQPDPGADASHERGLSATEERLLEIAPDASLASLHDAIQRAFGWTDDHLHEFEAGNESYGVPHDFMLDVSDEREATVADLFAQPETPRYVYDYTARKVVTLERLP